MNIKALIAAGAVIVAMTPAAHAYVSGVEVFYYSYAGNTIGTNADAGNPIWNFGANAGAADAAFFYNGPVNWVYSGPQSGPNAVNTFLNINDVQAFSSPSGKFATVTDFGNSTLSVAGDATSAYFAVLGSAKFGTVSVTHDDGAVMYVDSYGYAPIYSPGETSVITNTASVSPGYHEYLVTYVEGNGAPSVLQVSVPEPSTWAMMLAGFAGLGFLGYRRNKAADSAA
jgi:hypothetical protein